MDNYNFGFNVYNNPPENFLDYCVNNNLKHIEINLSSKHSLLNSFTIERIIKLKSFADEFKLTYSFHLPYETNIADNILGLSRSSSNYIKKAIEIASQMGVKYITCHMGFFFWFPVEKWQRTKALKRFIKKIKSIVKICEEKNVILAFENVTPLPQESEHYLLGDNIEDFKILFSEVDSDKINFCLDTGHANLSEGVEKYLDNFSHKLCLIHFHDNHKNNDEHLPVGEGMVEWDKFAEKIKIINFKGPFISECRNIKPHEAAGKLKKHLIK